MPNAQQGQTYSWKIPPDQMPTGTRPIQLLLTFESENESQRAGTEPSKGGVYPEGLTLDMDGNFSGTIGVTVDDDEPFTFKVMAINLDGVAISPPFQLQVMPITK